MAAVLKVESSESAAVCTIDAVCPALGFMSFSPQPSPIIVRERPDDAFGSLLRLVLPRPNVLAVPVRLGEAQGRPMVYEQPRVRDRLRPGTLTSH